MKTMTNPLILSILGEHGGRMYHTTVSIDVPDLESAVRFYTEALGLKIKKEPTKSMVLGNFR